MIRAVMFDFWGTLVTGVVNEKTLGQANRLCCQYLKKQGYNINYEDCRKRRDNAYNKYHELVAKGIHLKPEKGLKRFMFHGINVKLKDIKKVALINELHDSDIKLRKGYKNVLKELRKRNCKIALVSNTWLSHGRHWLEKKNIDKYFDAIILSSDIGIAKPDKRIFELAAKRLKVPLAECVFVGDQHSSDIHGAHMAGIKCKIAIEPFKKDHNLAPPTAIVKDLAEILPIIDNLNV